ncbi:MAG TPA: hypothetical protein V6D29_07890 [Leptolyngbyaceae cyanobacterium]
MQHTQSVRAPSSTALKWVAIALLTAFLLPACSTPAPTGRRDVEETYDQESMDQEATNGNDVPEELPGNYTVLDQSIANPADYVGQQVVVSGRVRTVYGDSAFLLKDEETSSPLQDEETMSTQDQVTSPQQEGILVLMPNPITGNVGVPEPGDYVQLKGEVRRFEPTELEQEYEFPWDDEMRSQLSTLYGAEPVIITQESSGSASPAPTN